MSGPDPERYIKLLQKYTLDFLTWSNVVYICQLDGDHELSERQKTYIPKCTKAVQVTDEKLKEIYIGKNYFQEINDGKFSKIVW